MSLFQQLDTLLTGENDRLQCEITALKEGGIQVRITPDLGATPSNATDEEINLRALMATPITVSGQPDEVDALLEEHLAKRAPIQVAGAGTIDALAAKMADATKKAEAAKPAKSTKAETPAKGSKAEAAAQPPKEREEVEPKQTKAPTLDDSF